jgi:hypothetical protein
VAWTLLISLAWADCDQRVTSAQLESRIAGAKEPVLFAEPQAADELVAIRALLEDGCVDGAVSGDALASYWLTVGAWPVLSDSAPIEPNAMTYAIGLGAEWDADYGPMVEVAWKVVLATSEDATLDLAFDPDPAALYLDGTTLYLQGEQAVVAGWHLVQWQDEGIWGGQAVVVRGGETLRVGNAAVETVIEPFTPAVPVEVEPERDPLRVHADVGVGYSVVHSRLQADGLSWAGTGGMPALVASGSVGRRVFGWAQGALGPTSANGRAAPLSHLTVHAGVGQRFFVSAGGLVMGLPIAGGQDPAAPEFTRQIAVGPQLRAGVLAGPLEISAHGQWLLGPLGGGLDVAAYFPVGPVTLGVGAMGETLLLPDAGTYSWGGLRVVLRTQPQMGG